MLIAFIFFNTGAQPDEARVNVSITSNTTGVTSNVTPYGVI